MKRSQIAGWTILIGGLLAVLGYEYHEAYAPSVIAAADAQRAQNARAVDRTLTQVGCASDIEGRDDGKTPAETVAKAIIAKCGVVAPAPEGPPCSTDPKCSQAMQRINLQVETEDVLEERYKRAQTRADDAKAALERAQPH